MSATARRCANRLSQVVGSVGLVAALLPLAGWLLAAGEMAAVIVRHVGKLYNLVASRIAVAVSKSVEHVVDAECVLVSSARCSTRGGSIRLGTAPARRVRVRR